MSRSMLAGLVALVLVPAPAVAQETAPEIESIRQDQLRADLFFLAGDAMRGRLTDTRENRMAAEWIKSRFERLGLKPVGTDGSYFHEYDLSTATLGVGNSLGVISGDAFNMQSRDSFYPLRFSARGDASGPVVFAGFGIASPSRGHDDFKDADLQGKVVLVMDHEPGERDPDSAFDGLVTSEVSRNVRKALAAQERGAAAVLFVSDVHNHPEPGDFERAAARYWPSNPRRVPRYSLATWVNRVRIPAFQISPEVAEMLTRPTGRSFAELAAAAEDGVDPLEIPDWRINVRASVNRHVVPDRNVVALLEGSDPALADEWVIIGAHYDHDGADGERILNGADDDGSGTVALIEIAEAYARAAERGVRPRRSVLFAAWNSEERGLLGAWAYTEDPLNPLDRTVAVLNMDMVGRNEEVPDGGGRRFRGLEPQTSESNNNSVNIMGYTYSPDLRRAIEASNARIGLKLKMTYDNNPSQLLRRSDQWPFLQNGVPAVFVHTGLHPDYHTENDVPDRINYEKMEKIARMVFQTSWNLAEAEGRPAFGRRATIF